MHLARRTRPTTRLATIAVAAALVAACGTGDDTTDPQEDEQTAPEEGADPDDLDADDLEDLLGGEQEDLDLPDPSEQVEDGVFRGVGITMPAPEGFELDPMALMQGTVIALTDDGLHTLAGQAVDTAELPEELDFDELVDGERESLGSDPSVDEEIDLSGADRAHLLRFDELPAQEEGQPANSLLAIIADDGNGQLAMFNYLAPTDDYSDDTESLMLSQSGFDPDSEPVSPMTG